MNIWNAMNKKIAMAIILFVSIFMLMACGGSTKEYIVTFNSMGGTAVEAITIEDGKTLELPAQPTRTGYTFDAWYLEESLTTPWTNLVISSSITVYAKWIINTYTITFNTDGGTSITNASVSYNQTLTEPTAPTKVGYTFAGWFTDANKTNAFAFTTPITQNITLYAKWDQISFTVSFDTDGGSAITNASVNYNQPLAQPTAPTKEGHTFEGWFTDAEKTSAYNFSSPVNSNFTLYAKFSLNLYTVSFETNGGVEMQSQPIYHGTKLESENPLYTGHRFLGWFTDQALTQAFDEDAVITSNLTLYAKWEIITLDVSFETNGGSTVSAQTVDYGSQASQPAAPTKEGYTFIGWYSNTALTESYVFTTAITSNITLYAKWQLNVYEATVHWNNGQDNTIIFIEHGSLLEEPGLPSREEHGFKGWYLDVSLSQVYDFSTLVTGDISIYAKWEYHNYTVWFISDLIEIDAQVVLHQEQVVVPTGLEIEGFNFIGYFEDPEYTTVFDIETPITSDLMIYVKHEKIVLNMSFIMNGGEEIDDLDVYYNDLPSVLPTPYYFGHTFLGWFLDVALETPLNMSEPFTASLVLYAKWEERPLNDEDYMNLDLRLIDLPDFTSTDITLPTTGANGTKFVWQTDSPHLITSTGRVLPAGYGTGGEAVVLTVTATKGIYKDVQTFEIIIEEMPESFVTNVRNVEFINLSTEYFPLDSFIDLFFMNEQDVPFVDIESFMYLVNGAINTIAKDPVEVEGDDGIMYQYISYVEFEMIETDVMVIRYVAQYYLDDVLEEENTYEAIIDFTENSFYSESFDFFDAMVASTSTNFGEGLSFGDSIVTEGHGIYIPLSKYRFDLVIHDDGDDTYYLMPLHVANLLFVGSVYFDVYYNGDKLYGIDSYQFLDDSPVLDQANTSSYNTKQISMAMKMANYDYLVLLFDYFYGLKDVNGVETYYDVFGSFVNNMIYSSTRTTHYRSIFDLTYSLDDLHTYHIMTGYHVSPTTGFSLSLNDLGSRSAGYYQSSWAIDDAIELAFPAGRPNIRITPDGKTAIYVINSFTVNTPKGFSEVLEDVKTNYPDVENFVIDLTKNGGGNVGAVWRTLGYMTDDVIYYHSQNPTEGSAVTYQIFDSYPRYDYNWYILTSPVTFSAANLMASTAKEQGIATIIGINSTGGASSISGTVLPTGDVIFISSTNVISTLIDGEYISVEYGVQVDFAFNGFNLLYDDEYIQSVINQLNQE